MPLYTQSIKNLKGGVSQQPDILRYQDQGSEQVNAWSSESSGLQKRPPALFKGKLAYAGDFGSHPKFHLINRDETEQYYIVFTGEAVRVFDLSGYEYPVTGSPQYITTGVPRDDIRVITVADYTFIVNRKKVIAEGDKVSHEGYNSKKRALINLRGGQYGRTLKVGINGGEKVEHKLPNGNNAETDPPKVDAQYIGAELIKLLTPKYSSFNFKLGSGYIVIESKDATVINTVDTEDGYANQLISGIIDTVQVVSKLPLAAPDGYIIKIQGETNSSADEYFVRYDHSTKTWKETVEPNTIINMDADTMPHALVRQSDGSFELKTLAWGERGAGNDDTNPMPSFVDSTISDVFFYRNRLGFLSGENVVMSRSASYFAFFPKSVATTSDDDPIDVAVSHPRISVLKYAVPFSEQLLLWSDEVQFVMTSSGVLTAKSIQLDVGSEFALSDSARPFAVGRSVFFSAPRGSYTSIKRYFAIQEVSDSKDADDTTGHVLSYIPNGVFDINGSSTENYVSVLSSKDEDRVYIYKFLFKEGQQLQASWSHWEFKDSKILAASSVGSSMYLVSETGGAIVLQEVRHLKEANDFESEPYRVHLDMKTQSVTPDDAYNVTTNLTKLRVPEHLVGTTVTHVDKTGRVRTVETKGSTPVNYGQVAIYGDSTVDGSGTSDFTKNPVDSSGNALATTDHRLESRNSWVTRLDALVGYGGAEIYNVGYQGTSIIDSWAINNIEKAIVGNKNYHDVKAVIMCFGLNDLVKPNWSVGLFKTMYADLIAKVRSLGMEPIIMTSQPATKDTNRPYDLVQKVLVPTQLSVAVENSCEFIDLNQMLLDAKVNLEELQFDGLHFGDAGHALVADLMRDTFVSFRKVTEHTVSTEGDFTGWCVMGKDYEMKYVFSRFLIKHEDQNGTITEDTGRLQLRRAWVNFQDSGAMDLVVSNNYREFINTYGGDVVASQTLGEPVTSTGQYRFPMNGDALNTTLTMKSSHPTPVSVVGCGWEASYAKKARSI